MTSFPRMVSVLLAVAPVPIAVSACSSTRAPGDLPAEPSQAERAIADDLVQLDPRTSEAKGERWLELALKNQGRARVACRCAADWIDAHGRTISTSGWQSIDLAPGEAVELRFGPRPSTAGSHLLRFQG